MNIHIQKIYFASTKNSGNPSFASELNFSFFIFLMHVINFDVIRTYITQFKWGQRFKLIFLEGGLEAAVFLHTHDNVTSTKV